MASPYRLEEGWHALQQRRFDDARRIYRAIIEAEPLQYRAWLALSALAQRAGEYRETVRCARKAAEAWKQLPHEPHLADVAMRLLALGEYETAVMLIRNADWSSDAINRQRASLAQYLDLAGLHDEALHAATAQRGPQTLEPRLSHARAMALQHLGRIDEAEAAFEQCIAADPLFADAHWALAHHASPSTSGKRIPRIRRALAHHTGSPDDRALLWYALFRELDAADDREHAWRALTQGMQIKRSVVRHDAAQDAASHEAMRRLFETRPSIFSDVHVDQDRQTPLFIVGLPRSGTTLVERILGSHRQVISAGELGDLAMQISWELDAFVGHTIVPARIAALADIDMRSLGAGYLARTHWRAQGHDFLIDKFPGNFLFTGLVSEAMPPAKTIIVRRSAMDSTFSLLKHCFSGDAYGYSYSLEEVAAHYQNFNRLCTFWQECFPTQVRVIEYEEIVTDLPRCVEQLRVFCGLPVDDDMEQPHRNAAPSATASAVQIRAPVHAAFVDQWRRYERPLQSLADYLHAGGAT